MANPQCENGYTKLANEIIEALYQRPLSGHEFRMLFLIIRKTYGFNKTEDNVSLSQMMKALSLSKTRCSQVINKLQLQKIVTVTENINGIGKKYKLNKNYEHWTTVHECVNGYRKMKSTVTLLRNEPLQKTVSTKETITKETITKEKVNDFYLPEVIKKETWEAYLEMRKTIKKPATKHAQNLIIKKLLKMEDDPNLILEQSIENSYQGVFPLKTGGTSGTNTNRGNRNQKVYSEQDRLADEINAEYYRRKAAETADNSSGNT